MRPDASTHSVSVCAAVLATLHLLACQAFTQPTGFLCAARDVLDRYQDLTDANSVAIHENFAFIADISRGLVVLDIADPTNIQFLGAVDTPGDAKRVSVSGHLALTADSSAGLHVIDVTEPSSPIILGTALTPGAALDVVVIDATAYVADTNGLSIIDFSEPTNPAVISSITTPGQATRLCVSGETAYVIDEGSGLRIIDVTEPTKPVLLTTIDITSIHDIAVNGTRGYLAHSYGTLTVLDLTNPSEPQTLTSLELPSRYTQDVAIDQNRLFINGLSTVFDLSDPDMPAYLGAGLALGRGIAVRDTLALVTFEHSLAALDIRDIPTSGVLGSLSSPDSVEGIEIQGSFAFTAELAEGMHIIDISNPASPTRVGSIDTGGFTHDVAVQGDYAYVVDFLDGFRVVDISNPAQPIMLNEPNNWQDDRVAVEGNTAAILSRHLRLIDVTNPQTPVTTGFHQVGNPDIRYHNQIRLANGYAYVSTGTRFLIFDTSQPTADPLATLEGTRPGLAVDPDRSVACLATHDGMLVVDITDPSNPLQTAHVELEPGNEPVSIEIVGNYAIASLEPYGNVWLVDLRDPHDPRAITDASGWFSTSLGAWDIEVNDSTAYFATVADGLIVLDISDCPCLADHNHDNTVDTRDIIAFSSDWAAQRGANCSTNDCSADITGDETVDSRDFIAFLNLWNSGC